MKKKFVASVLLLVVFSFGALGCNSLWWQNFRNDPSAQVNAFEASAHTALNIADIAWNTTKDYLPAATLAVAAPKYAAAVLVVNKALNALSDGMQVAVDAKETDPDFTQLLQAVTDGVAQVVSIVNEFRASSVTAQASDAGVHVQQPVGVDDLNATLATMKHIGHTK